MLCNWEHVSSEIFFWLIKLLPYHFAYVVSLLFLMVLKPDLHGTSSLPHTNVCLQRLRCKLNSGRQEALSSFGSSLRIMVIGSVWSPIHPHCSFQHMRTLVRHQKSSQTHDFSGLFLCCFFLSPFSWTITSSVHVIFDNTACQMKQGDTRSHCGLKFWSRSS